MVQHEFNKDYVGQNKQGSSVGEKQKCPDNGKFQRWTRSQGQMVFFKLVNHQGQRLCTNRKILHV